MIFFSPCHSALHPFIAQLERAAGFARDDTPEAKLAKLRVLLVPGSRDDEDIALLTELLRAVDQRLKAGQFAAARSALKINPARRIYERLGFNVTYEDQHKVYMRREPDGCSYDRPAPSHHQPSRTSVPALAAAAGERAGMRFLGLVAEQVNGG